MIKAIVRATLLALMFPLLLNATHILRNNLIKVEAEQLINTIGEELHAKTGINAYVIATNEHFPERYNLVEHSKQYETNISKPYVLFIFAPYATITKKSESRGRVGIIPSSDSVGKLYDYDDVRAEAINVVAVKDSNTPEDKYNIGVVQAYSELADNIATSKNVELENTIPNEMGIMLTILRILVYTGTVIVLWIFIFKPFYLRMKHGKK